MAESPYVLMSVFKEFEKRIEAAIAHGAEVTKIVQASAKEAIEKAETAQGKRFDNLNEFNARMKELSDTYLPRETYATSYSNLETRIRNIENAKDLALGRSSTLDPILMLLLAGCGGLVVFVIQAIFKR